MKQLAISAAAAAMTFLTPSADADSGNWDRQQHNGYTYNGHWHFGPPPPYVRGDVAPGYRAWREGDRLPAYYRSHYTAINHRRAQLDAPPKGFRYVRDERGDVLLINGETGAIERVLRLLAA